MKVTLTLDNPTDEQQALFNAHNTVALQWHTHATPPDPKDQRIAELERSQCPETCYPQTTGGCELIAERDQLHARVQELESQLLQMAGTQAAGLAREEKLFKELDAAHAEADKWQADWAKQMEEAVSLRAECERLAAEHQRCMERYGNAKRLAAEYRAEAETDAGTRALACVEALREIKGGSRELRIRQIADDALSAWDQGAKRRAKGGVK